MEHVWVRFALTLLALLVLSVPPTVSRHHPHHHKAGGKGAQIVVIRSISRLGEQEIRVRYGRRHALEVVIPHVGENGLYYRQIADGRRLFLQGIYKGRDNLIDCDVTNDKGDIRHFLTKFAAVEQAARAGIATPTIRSNVSASAVVVDAKSLNDVDPIARHLLDTTNFRRRCHRLQKQVIRQYKEQLGREESQAIDTFSRLQGKELDPSLAGTLFDSGARKGKSLPSSPPAPSPSSSRRRQKRFIYPGTKWCGSGNEARDFDDLGENVATDKCCRNHDHCPYTISSFTTRFNLFNYRLHTLSHCQCDEIFRTCLRLASNSVADMVGSIFFNVASTKCFTLRRYQRCARRSWWGGCREYTDDFQAELNEPFEY